MTTSPANNRLQQPPPNHRSLTRRLGRLSAGARIREASAFNAAVVGLSAERTGLEVGMASSQSGHRAKP